MRYDFIQDLFDLIRTPFAVADAGPGDGAEGASTTALRPGQSGMSLIEIIIVVALLGGLMAFVVSGLTAGARNAKNKETEISFHQLRSSLQMYKLNGHHFPTTEQGLKALVEKPADASGWRGPYCEPELLIDAWGTPIQYESDGREVKFVSAGDDEKIGTDDDIVWPAPKEETSH